MPGSGRMPLAGRAWPRALAVALTGAAVLGGTGQHPALAAANADGRTIAEWRSMQHPRHGFMIAWPSSVFDKRATGSSDDGEVFLSRDGTSKLLVGTFENSAGFTLKAYRDYLVENSYAGAKIDYEKWHSRWFVISGVMGDTMFYERVTFTCGGKLVNSWAMLYPVALRSFYDRVVEAVAKTYSAGAGPNGRCSDLP